MRLGSVASAFLPKPSQKLVELLPDIEEQPVIATANNNMLSFAIFGSFVVNFIFYNSKKMHHHMFKIKIFT